MGTLNDKRCVDKYTKPKGHPNAELTAAAVAARTANYKSYGKMQAEEYARIYTSGIKQTIAQKRKTGEYRTVRERMAEKEKEKHPSVS